MEFTDKINYFYTLTKIPIQYYENNQEAIVWGTLEKTPALPTGLSVFKEKVIKLLLESNKKFCYMITPVHLIYALIYIANGKHLIIGPVVSIHDFELQYEKLAIATDAEENTTISLRRWMRELPNLTLHQFLIKIKFLHSTVTSAKVSQIEELSYLERTIKDYLPHNETILFDQLPHPIEKEMISCIAYGKVKELTTIYSCMNTTPFYPPISGNVLRSQRNIFIAAVAIASRAAIKGGMEYTKALNRSSQWINRVEELETSGEIMQELYNMILYYAKEVQKVQVPSTCSPYIVNIISFIQNHLSKKYTVTDLAKELNLSPSYVSHHFKEQTGISISSYIARQKIEEAKRLLSYTDVSLAQIATILGFSSQQYFQNVFKKIVGMTPSVYRKEK
jgi:AraC-like DNA-binding protein